MNPTIKKLVISIVLTASALILAVTSTVAWFFVFRETGWQQNGYIGIFEVNLSNSTTHVYSEAKNINVSNEFPITQADAMANPNRYMYKFRVANEGNITAMYRFDVALTNTNQQNPVLDDSNLSRYLYYRVRSGYNSEQMDDWNDVIDAGNGKTRTYFIEDSPSNAADNLSLQEYFKEYLLNPVYDDGDLEAVYGRSEAVLTSGKERIFELYIWLHKSAKLEGASKKTTKFTLTMYAMQTAGSASWEHSVWTD